MKRYKLLMDLPTFDAGERFFISRNGNLCYEKEPCLVVYHATTLKKFPSILIDWFEEIPEEPKTVDDLCGNAKCWVVGTDSVYQMEWCNIPYAVEKRAVGEIVMTEEEGLKKIARRKAKVILERDTKGYDWHSAHGSDKYHWSVFTCGKNLEADDAYGHWGEICFATEKDARDSMEKHEKEWKIYLGVEE